jgi:hypothetical protein
MPYDMTVARCQCDPGCNNKPKRGEYFCEVHKRQCSRRAPLTGLEPSYDPNFYKNNPTLKDANNCYAYAVGFHEPSVSFPQPGRASGYPTWSKVKGKRCPDVMARAMGDIKDSRMSTFNKKCPSGMRKIAFIVDKKSDYHVVRQNSNGFWTHKPGSTDVTDKDALKRKIYDPSLASWKYPKSGLHYEDFCGFLCIPATRKHQLKHGGQRSTKRNTKRRTTRKRHQRERK